MKSTFNRSVLLLLGVLLSGNIIAQQRDSSLITKEYLKIKNNDSSFRTWSVGLNFGILTFSNIFQKNSQLDFTSPVTKVGYGVYVKKQILPRLGFQGQFFAGNLNSDNSQETTNGVPNYLSFSTSLKYTASINAIFIIANLNYNKLGIQPYVGAGFGLIGFHPVLAAYNSNVGGIVYTDLGGKSSLFVPVQAGLKFNVSHSVNLDFAYQLNFVSSDIVDGYNYGPTNDKFSYVHFGVELALGNRTKPQLSTYKRGQPMRYEILSKHKKAPTLKSKDTVTVKNEEVQNNSHLYEERLKKLSMDSDSDGVSDFLDRCPNTPRGVKVDNYGCPVVEGKDNVGTAVTDKEKQILNDAMNALLFDNGRAKIADSSLLKLDKLVGLLIEKKMNINQPQKILIIIGYGDATGSYEFNLELSNERALAVKNYLVSKGIRELNIVTVGYGKSGPASGYKTDTGKQLARRVEFTLY